ncbi:MAG: hypothetical protein HOD97_01475 [Candidatus Marinimicrobia bacterium]|jgi:hypothetical protein|nr:hypothetical protein [Candidatus Neomarinimicrobiota bacterium]MBT3618030.1 hypothetical protein [Candidatus Neomarinimicrobiota bacterium]MBT3828513.1 hypothetical protein [Candidatus Neomarinimicrobiota bacterium]MBT3998016.1 hypothetical protein [Candidatus Neomarinimicrobiota bacterium]MBT4280280.1 hypothetical protein [Candidatus Neomarinimicrobiota bacterium]
MKLPLKTRIALRFHNAKRHRSRLSKKLTITQNDPGISSLLIAIPEPVDQRRVALAFINALKDSIGKTGHITLRIVGDEVNRNNIGIDLVDDFRGYSNTDINRFGILKSSALNRILSRKFDAAVDLNPDFHPVTAQLVCASNAHLRIGFQSEEKESFFNVFIERDKEGFIEMGYLRIQKLLGL